MNLKLKTVVIVISTALLCLAVGLTMALHPAHPWLAALAVNVLWMSACLRSWADNALSDAEEKKKT